jgi:hypothetical protein
MVTTTTQLAMASLTRGDFCGRLSDCNVLDITLAAECYRYKADQLFESLGPSITGNDTAVEDDRYCNRRRYCGRRHSRDTS